jgi:hypothetical protein
MKNERPDGQTLRQLLERTLQRSLGAGDARVIPPALVAGGSPVVVGEVLETEDSQLPERVLVRWFASLDEEEVAWLQYERHLRDLRPGDRVLVTLPFGWAEWLVTGVLGHAPRGTGEPGVARSTSEGSGSAPDVSGCVHGVGVPVPDVSGCVHGVHVPVPDVSGCVHGVVPVPDVSGCVHGVGVPVPDVSGYVREVGVPVPDVSGCVREVGVPAPDVRGCAATEVGGSASDVSGCAATAAPEAVLQLRAGQRVVILGHEGEPLLRVHQGADGPVFELARDHVELQAPHRLRLSAESIELSAGAGGVDIQTEGDAVIRGKAIRLN